jgi:hypothetical protein
MQEEWQERQTMKEGCVPSEIIKPPEVARWE